VFPVPRLTNAIFVALKQIEIKPRSSAFAVGLFRLRILAVKLLHVVLFLLGWEMGSFKYILRNDDNEGHDDDDDDDDRRKKSKFYLR
jgi:hypothetical protein